VHLFFSKKRTPHFKNVFLSCFKKIQNERVSKKDSFSLFVFMSLLSTLLFLPLFGVFILFFIPNWKIQVIRRIALNTSLLTFLLSLLLWIEFDSSTARFQFLSGLASENSRNAVFSGFNFVFGVD
jgi:hypothetical protein